MKNKKLVYGGMGVFLVLFFIYTFWFNSTHTYSADPDAVDTMTYVKGKVLEIVEERLSPDAYPQSDFIGEQDVKVLIKHGIHKGEEVLITNYVSTTHHVLLEVNDTVMVGIDDEDNGEVHYYIFQFYRLTSVFILIGLFALLIIVIGRKKGIMTVLSLAFALYTIIAFTIPLVYNGSSPVYIGIMTVAIITFVTLVLLNGASQKTYAAIVSTATGVILSGVIYAIFARGMHINGFNISESDSILGLSLSHGLKIYYISFAGIFIASLGAVMDVAMSITSALYEMIEVSNNISKSRLFKAGMNIGKDMIGTMTNTLILAFAGGSFINLILYAAFNMDTVQFLNSDFIAVEILQGIASTAAVVLTVPIASLVASVVLIEDREANANEEIQE